MAYKIKKAKKEMYDERIRPPFEWNNPFAYTEEEKKRKIELYDEEEARIKLNKIKSRVAKDNFIRKMIKKGIYL